MQLYSSEKLALKLILKFAIVLLLAIGCFIAYSFLFGGYVRSTHKFASEIKKKINIPMVRSWLNSQDWNEISKSNLSGVNHEDYPECISELKPKYVSFIKKEKAIKLEWGGGFGHWGIVIGPENMPTQTSTKEEYRETIENGCYAWHEIQR